MKVLIIALLLFVATLPAFSQSKDSLSAGQQAGIKITDKFPSTRTFDLRYELLGPADYDVKLFGQKVENGKIQNHSRLKLAANIVVYTSKKKNFFITNSVRYKYESIEFGTLYNTVPASSFNRPTQDFHYWSESVSATYFSKLFNKMVIYNASATVDGNDKKLQRLKGFLSATMVLKKTANTTITLGALGLIDPSSILPFAPVFTYEHQFSNSPWQLDIIIPQRILLKRKLLENGRLSIGTELNSENFYIYFSNEQLNGNYELNQLELKSGITYEYNFAKNFIGTFKAGLNNIITSRVTERGKKTDRYVIENTQDARGYFNLGLSYNPF